MVKKKAALPKPGASRAKKSTPAKFTPMALPRIGAEWPGEGGRFVGIIRGEKGQPDYRLLVATDKRAALKGPWGPAAAVKGTGSEYDGLANTQAMAAAGSEIAKRALTMTIAGHKDFYIPSRREARLIWTNAPKLLPPEWLWTSTQSAAYSACAWAQTFGDGNQGVCHESDEFAVRLVRRIPIR